MPWWISLIIELCKLLIPIIISTAKKPKEERREAVRELGKMVREGIGSPPQLKKI